MFKKTLLYLGLALPLFIIEASCGNSPTQASKQAPEAARPTQAQAAPPPTQPPPEEQPQVNKPVPPSGGNKVPDEKIDNSKLPGTKAFVTKDETVLLTRPNSKADKIAPLKKGEAVYILETSMRNDLGVLTQYPTWYRVERQNKQTGWVVATSVDAGGGG